MTLALQQEGRPSSRLYESLHRVADRLDPELRREFIAAMERVRSSVNEGQLLNALRRKDTDAVVHALGLTAGFRSQVREGLEAAYRRGVLAGSEVTVQESLRAGLFEASFTLRDPNAVLAARRDVGTLITRIDNETRLAVRGVVGDMFTSGVPPAKASPRLRSILGLTRPQAGYVSNFTSKLEKLRSLSPGDDSFSRLVHEATDRRLDAVTKGRIRKAAKEGRITDSLVEEFTETYSKSMRNRRALNVGRTESIRASHAGQQETWKEAVRRGQLDENRTRRRWIVTPDDRLRETHAAIPGMNEEGVRIDEPFETPMGPLMQPPAGVNCRCSVGLTFAGGAGVL